MLTLDLSLLRKLEHPEDLRPDELLLVVADAACVIRTMEHERHSWRASYRHALYGLSNLQQEIDELRPDAVRFGYLCATADPGRDLRAEIDTEMDKNSAP